MLLVSLHSLHSTSKFFYVLSSTGPDPDEAKDLRMLIIVTGGEWVENNTLQFQDKIYKMENNHKYSEMNSRMIKKRSVFGISVTQIEKKFYEENMTTIAAPNISCSQYFTSKYFTFAFVILKTLLVFI